MGYIYGLTTTLDPQVEMTTVSGHCRPQAKRSERPCMLAEGTLAEAYLIILLQACCTNTCCNKMLN